MTTEPVTVALAHEVLMPPEFIRLPRPGHRCPITGLSRSTLRELADAGNIKAVKLRKRGSLRGITLIHRTSLLDYLNGLKDQKDQPNK